MALLALNGIDISSIALAIGDTQVMHRDIGGIAVAADGSSRATRQTRKTDLKFKSIPLIASDVFTWESYLIGEGETWSFETGSYGSKGLGYSASSGATVVGTTPKFGSFCLQLAATTGSITYALAMYNTFGAFSDTAWTFMIWRRESGVWHHYIVRSDGAKWVDGVRNDGASTTWFAYSAGGFTLTNTAGAAQLYDDMVAFPFNVLDAWPPIFGVSTAAFSLLPYLNASGGLVPEQATRIVIGQVESKRVMRVAGPVSGTGVRRSLDVELKAR